MEVYVALLVKVPGLPGQVEVCVLENDSFLAA